ncbi:hypothetical protein BABINDRAFT_160651 [Babjeviella inositovora NRRL Y-12698]|uniref:Cysteine proteinase 1, mitochondrial n=1 Tax=Babjeviella inositovora NRRL Y-12698 TaxID=984486 RepID=A0A1E3QW19_9ASCO|nr:uncharacterized protein BABINDRAFT_160651 [Babjeviella inositovora NRRL Y-12698]ODQ81282.1 hypothetical protein BABINDRAFT_160651 [Babjeviella inositovora NRRL Y-12698]
MTSSLPLETLSSWKDDFRADATFRVGSAAVGNFNADEVLINNDVWTANCSNTFSHVIETEGAPILSQGSAGSCWLHAAGNVLRVELMEKYSLKEFEFSIPYLFFHDKLEKANFFLEQIIQTAAEPVESRLIQHLLSAPVNDGGQFDLFVNVVKKYGMVPLHVFPKTFTATASRTLNFLLTTKLREWAEVLRARVAALQDITELRTAYQKELYRLLCMFFGVPPGPDEAFTWEYHDKDKAYHSIESTPLKFASEILGYDGSEAVSLINDPRNAYNRVLKIDRLGNVIGEPLVHYLNLASDDLAAAAIARIKENKPVFFGTHSPLYMDKKRGLMDVALYDYAAIGYVQTQEKAARIKYAQSLMTHAMAFTGVHLDAQGVPVRWRVENSWGKTSGIDGYYIMTHDYFKEYVYQVVADKKELGADLTKLFEDGKKDPIVLPPWDAMGSLAVFKNAAEPQMEKL